MTFTQTPDVASIITGYEQRISALERQCAGAIAQTGDIKMTGGGSAPAGWLTCDGAAVLRTTYAALFTLVGVTFGVGDGSTTFNLPDLRGRTPVGTGTGAGLTTRALGASGGEEAHILTVPEMPSHTHGPPAGWDGFWVQRAADANVAASGANFKANNSLTATGPTGGDGGHNNMQPFRALTFVVKT